MSNEWTPKDSAGTKTAPDVGAKAPTKQKVGAHKKRDWIRVDRNRTTGRVTLRPNAELLKQAKIYCIKRGLTMTEFFEQACAKAVQEVGAHNGVNSSVGAKAPFDDRRSTMIDDEKPASSNHHNAGVWAPTTDEKIIKLYVAYNIVFNENVRWKPADDLTAQAYNETDIRIVELGILYTQLNKLRSDPACRIHSFKFFTHEIDTLVAINPGDVLVKAMLDAYRAHWREASGGVEIDLSFLNE